MGNALVLPLIKYLPDTDIVCYKSVVKAAYGGPDTLRQAIFKMFRIIIPIEKIIEDEITRPLLSLTRNKFTMFSDETRTMSWLEGRECVYDILKIHSQANICSGTLQAIDIGYLVTSKDERKAGTFCRVDAFEFRI
jgi:hypothetical protein